jgi:hypothetical protein
MKDATKLSCHGFHGFTRIKEKRRNKPFLPSQAVAGNPCKSVKSMAKISVVMLGGSGTQQ